ncbi:hypothetical protein [Microbulbifer sp. SH-1]
MMAINIHANYLIRRHKVLQQADQRTAADAENQYPPQLLSRPKKCRQ